MLILGIDPGLSNLGYAIVEDKDPPSLVEYGVIETKKTTPYNIRLREIFEKLQSLFKKYKPEVTVLEKLYFKKNVKTAMRIGEVRGVIFLLTSLFNSEISEISPSKVKSSFTGFGRAGKKEMKRMAEILFKKRIKEDDSVDAIAIALAYINTKTFEEKGDLLS